ncbi:prepilin peptidase [Lactobacillus xujianguonis]|uniref:Prepilin peptidase n=1 Tax=Lactobacillus xujianguonis TaxID=2495899 RepID=A0A437SV77_9LACO|nr:A24 family peptidase [Lactobacillus xujianguonis]RVU70727.1 prepilin peptidase [Lactobacillus xujianguonis]
MFILVNFYIGSCLASHAAVIFERRHHENFIFGRSHCNNCHNELSLLDELPLISYLGLKGKCRYCQSEIPYELFLIEIIGGLAFINFDFSEVVGIKDAIFLFFFLVIAIFDFYEQEFPTILLLPLIGIASSYYPFNFTKFEWFELIVVSAVLLLQVLTKKLGSGDLIIYLALAFNFSPTSANLVFLIASLLLLLHYLLKANKSKRAFAFVPYLFVSLVILQTL